MFDFDIIDTKTLLGESGFYLHKSNEIVFLDLLDPTLFIYSLENNHLYKEKIKLPKPLGNVYPQNNGNFYLSCFNGLYNYNRRSKNITKVIDVRKEDELKHISYNDGTITKNKLWIGLCHLKETKDLGYFGYLTKNNFEVVDRKFKVSNGPAIDEKNNKLYFSDSFNSKLHQYNLKNFERKTLIKFKKKDGFPDGIALDNNNGLWVAHWAGAKVSRINLKNGKIDFSINLPALNITSVTFFGNNLNHLFVTSAKYGVTGKVLKRYPRSGSCFIIKTNYKGIKIPYTNINF
jgi:sugar lactone lactonase YvrE